MPQFFPEVNPATGEFVSPVVKAHIDGKVPASRTVAGKPLTADVDLTAADVGAATAAQGAKADTAVQPAGLPTWGTIPGRPSVVADGATASAARAKIGAVATVNGVTPDGTGNVTIATGGGGGSTGYTENPPGSGLYEVTVGGTEFTENPPGSGLYQQGA